MIRKLISWGAAVMVLGFLCASVASYVWQWHGWKPARIEGVVLRADSDPRKQVPVARAEVTATNGRFEDSALTSPAGYFNLEVKSSWQPQQALKLLVRHPGYAALELPSVKSGELYMLHLKPQALPSEGSTQVPQKPVPVSDVRVRYSVKTTNTMNVGSAAKTFEAPGEANVPCDSNGACSPDGKWKAISSTQTFDAGEHTEFRNARLACIAGPCPFTSVVSPDLASPHRFIKVTVNNWSGTATFLLEAEVTQTSVSEMVMQAYPVIFGSAMNFTLPASAEGPSVEAAISGLDIVFPLGPSLNLSWGECSEQPAGDNATQYRCILKPGFQFQ
jgi:hypothetical protein